VSGSPVPIPLLLVSPDSFLFFFFSPAASRGRWFSLMLILSPLAFSSRAFFGCDDLPLLHRVKFVLLNPESEEEKHRANEKKKTKQNRFSRIPASSLPAGDASEPP
jgi:hypothetical protein